MSGEDLTFSVVIPTYQQHAMLFEAVESVLTQTRRPEEIIVVADGLDEVLDQEVAKRFGQAVRYETSRRGNESTTRNHGIQLAKSKFVSFLDHDDLWHPHHLAETEALLRARPSARAVHGARWTFSSDPTPERVDLIAADLASCLAQCTHEAARFDPTSADIAGESFSRLLERAWCLPSTITVERSLLLDIGGFPPGIPPGPDWLFTIEVARFTEWHRLPRRTVFYRTHPASTTNTARPPAHLERIRLIEQVWRDTTTRPSPPHPPLTAYGHEYRKVVQAAIWEPARRGEVALAWRARKEGRALLPRRTDRLFVDVPLPLTYRVEAARRRLRRGLATGLVPQRREAVGRPTDSIGSGPLRIALSSYYLPSESKIGAGHQAHGLAQALCRAGHDVTMFSPCSKPADALYEHVEVDVPKPFATFRWALALRQQDLSHFDVFHAAGDDHWFFGKSRPAHVRTLHGSCLAEAMHIRGAKERLRMVLLGLSELLATVVADKTVLISDSTQRWFPWVRTVIPDGVDLDLFHPGDEKEEQPTVLFVGTYENRKRGRLLMEVFEQHVRRQIPDARLWMVCSDAPSAPGVEVLGRLTDEELADRYRRAWVFCLPSTYEGFGVPYAEALASGTAVVATPNPGALDVLCGGKYGKVVPDEELGRTLTMLLSNEGERDDLACRGLARAGDFDWRSVVTSYEAIYRALLASPPRTRTWSLERQP